jgi:ice-binding like protein
MHSSQTHKNVRSASASGFRLVLLTLLATLALAGTANAATAVPLGSASTFAVLGGQTVTNTGPTVLNGDLGISPGTACTGFPAPCTGGGPGVVNGTIHAADTAAAQAQLDLTTAYNNAAGQPGATIGPQLAGATLGPGVYNSASGFDIAVGGTLTLDAHGNTGALFIFQAGSTVVANSGSRVNLINGAQSCNIFWQVGSSATIGTNTMFSGNVLALTSIAAQTGAVIDGRLLARNGSTTLDTNTVTRPQCTPLAAPIVTITGLPKPGPKGSTQCIARNFKLHLTVAAPNAISSTDVFLDGKRIKRSSMASFAVTIKAKGLSPGPHKIRVVTRDAAGNTRVARARFKRCGTARIKFTG